MNKIEAQRVKIGQTYNGRTVTAIRKLMILGKSAVILKCDENEFTLSAEQKVVVV